VQGIYKTLVDLNNKRGGKSRSWNESYKHRTLRPSIQGTWFPEQWTHLHQLDFTQTKKSENNEL